jgi:hypothetical protein
MKALLSWFLPILIYAPACAANKNDVTCHIELEKPVIEQGTLPPVTVSIINETDKPIVLLGSLDGSDVGWRYPKCGFELFDENKKPLSLGGIGRCGNMNPLRAEDFVQVGSGNRFNPYGKGFFSSHHLWQISNYRPGTYYLRFYYQTRGTGVKDFFGDERMMKNPRAPANIQALAKQVPHLDLKSNFIKLTITKSTKPDPET